MTEIDINFKDKSESTFKYSKSDFSLSSLKLKTFLLVVNFTTAVPGQMLLCRESLVANMTFMFYVAMNNFLVFTHMFTPASVIRTRATQVHLLACLGDCCPECRASWCSKNWLL